MPTLTTTIPLTSLTYTIPSLNHTITLHLPNSSKHSAHLPPNSTHRILEIPLGSHWQPGAHWHEEHTEYIKILQGTAKVWINGRVRVLGEGEEVVFERRDVHNFCRAEIDGGEVLVVEEWTDREDGSKQVFFRNAFSLVRDTEKLGGLLWAFLRFFYLCSYRDNLLVFGPLCLPFWAQRFVTGVVFGVVRVVGRFAGWRSWYEEYTPVRLREVAEGRKKNL
ncbi:hypothetical protein M409DRAFT_24691 [Zasmidium cellare ATCC 36951]|uniref:Cupin type-2 domain-containing protein n=1 Tax=Zasmidium cellare ATCC 36951 TaxID=1080233 RepID=A0A6A6CH85_ZASCE|nr:uncharacterized protein M409DRAFT_24691 [Zasmidium cellare ATCC 36951]KAF2164786.1 hypothetical protein M409DRAFT_24691 [Zasmidium cellare ATCC 36951]